MKTYTMAQAAKKLGISRQTLYDWIKAGHVIAPKPTATGEKKYRLWTVADIACARKFNGTLKRGPKRPK